MGINIHNKGSIILNQVNAANNRTSGAYLENVYWNGIKNVSSGNITILNSAFMNNGLPGVSNEVGLSFYTYGNVLLNGVVVFGNNGNGAEISSHGKTLSIKNSVFSNNTANPDSSTDGYGIYVWSSNTANITLENVTLDGNEADGAFLTTMGNILLKKVYAANNGSQGVLISDFYSTEGSGAKNVTILESTFSENKQNNLEIRASGAVKIVNLLSTFSLFSNGLVVNNVYALNSPPVTILGAVFYGNSFRGGLVISKGAITVSGITATGNGGSGLYLDNHETGATGNVTVLGSLGLNQLNGNPGGSGIYVETNKNVNLASIQANGNGLYGVAVGGYGDKSNVKLVNVEASANTSIASSGVYIGASGAVTLSKVFASENGGEGIYIDNSWAPIARMVKISGSFANGNEKDGVTVFSAGAIILSGVTASGNTQNGAYLENNMISSPTQIPQGITVVKSIFDRNHWFGMALASQRKITLTSIQAFGNIYSGVDASNNSSTISSAIMVTGVNRFNSNGYNGLNLTSSGTINISGVAAMGNGRNGVSATTSMGVIVKNSRLEGNGWSGVKLTTQATTNLSGLTVHQNGFGGFDDPGIFIYSTGIVIVSSSIILANSGWGLYVDVNNPATDCKITSNVIVIGNDAGVNFDDGNIWVH